MDVVVGAAIVRGGRVLAAHRSRDPIGWEFPGGKVEDGETDADALVRECREELGVEVSVGAVLAAHPIDAHRVLRVYLAQLAECEPQPTCDHDELRWCTARDLAALTWLPADRGVIPVVSALLQDGTPADGRARG